jgi:O-antigen/teichoic acid export membrane protein
MVEYFYLIRKQNRPLVVYAVISFFLQFLLVAAPVIAGLPVRWAMLGLVIASLFRYVWMWRLFIIHSEIHFSLPFVRDHLRLGGPLVLSTLLSGTAQYVDGFIVTSKFDESTFAVFRYGARELPLAVLLTNALGSALLPAFGVKERLRENLTELKRNITRLMHLLFPVTGVLILVSHPLFPWLFNPAFRESATIFNIYLLLVISRVLMPQTILTGLQQTRQLMIASFLELILNVGLSLLFVQYWGVAGVAFATFIAYLFEKVYLAVVVKRRWKLSFSEYQPVRSYLIYSLGILALFIFAESIF